MMENNEIGLANVLVGDKWQIRHHNLSLIDPDDLSNWEHLDLLSIWPWYFVQDLLQVEQIDGSALIDVGWIPDGEFDGEFLVEYIVKDQTGKFNWSEPVFSKNTRSLKTVLTWIGSLSSS